MSKLNRWPGRLLAWACAILLAACATKAGKDGQRETTVDFKYLAKTEIDRVADANRSEVMNGLLLIADKLGVKAELLPVTSSNRVPYLQTHKADLVISTLGKNAEREKVIDFTVAYSPFFIAVFGPKTQALKAPADLAGKSIGVTRGSVDDTELTKVAPASAEVRRFEDNTATISAFVAGQTQFIATSAQVAGAMMARNPQLGTEYKFVLKDSPNYIGLAKGEDKLRLRVNEILLEAKKSGDLDRLAVKWLGRPAGDLPQ